MLYKVAASCSSCSYCCYCDCCISYVDCCLFCSITPRPLVVSASSGSAAISLALQQYVPHAIILVSPLLSTVRSIETHCAAIMNQHENQRSLSRCLFGQQTTAAPPAAAPPAAAPAAAEVPTAAAASFAATEGGVGAATATAAPTAAAASAAANVKAYRALHWLQQQRLVGSEIRVYLVAAAESLLLQQYVYSIQEEAAAWQQLEVAVQHLLLPVDDLLRLAPQRLQQQELLQQLLPWGPERLRDGLKVAAQLHADNCSNSSSSSSSGKTAAEIQAAKAALLLQLRAVGIEPSQALNSWRGGGIAAAAAAAAATAAKAAGDELMPTVVVDAREMRCALPYELFCKQLRVHPTTFTVGDYVLTRYAAAAAAAAVIDLVAYVVAAAPPCLAWGT